MDEKRRLSNENEMAGTSDACCPSCGRYVGVYQICPHCGARVRTRISVTLLKIFSLVVSIIGLVLLWWSAKNRMVQTVHAAEIDNTTNFAYAQVKGVATRSFTYDPNSKVLSFPIDDGTGVIWIKAYGPQAEEIFNSRNLPMPGDTVIAEGTIRLKGDFTFMTINLPEKLTIISPQPLIIDIAEIEDSLYFVVVKTTGIINFSRLFDNSVRLQLCSPFADACVDANFYFSQFPELKNYDFKRGDTVSLSAMVSSYKDKLTLVPRSQDEFVHKKGIEPSRRWTTGEKPPENAPQVSIAALTEDMLNKYVKISGKIQWTKQIKGGMLVGITDGTGQMSFPIWDRVFESIPNKEAIAKGTTISFIGKVGKYKESLQVLPLYGPAVEVKGGAISEPVSITQSSGQKKNINELTSEMIGQTVVVEGTITKVKRIKGGMLVTIDDGTGTMTFPIWEKTFNHIPNKEMISEGNIISFSGKVGEYKGAIQVIPSRGENVSVVKGEQVDSSQKVEKIPASEPIKIQLVELSNELIGQSVTVEGEITSVKEIKNGVLVTIRQLDEYIVIPVWEKALPNIDRSKLIKGKYIEVTGRVEEYKGKLQVVPQKNSDIKFR